MAESKFKERFIMAKQINEVKQPMEVIKFNLQRQNEQGEALVQVINRVEEIKEDVDDKFSEMSSMLQKVEDSVTLTYEEQKELQSTVFKLSINLAKESFNGEAVSKKEFSDQVGKFRRSTWKKLKERMNVPRYSSIRRIDFDDSLDFVNSLKMKDFLEV